MVKELWRKARPHRRGRPQKLSLPLGDPPPPPNRCTWLHGPTRVHNRNAISTGSDQVVVEAPRHKETVAGSTEDNAVTYMQIRGLTRPVVTGECLVGEPKHADSHPVNCVGEKSPPPGCLLQTPCRLNARYCYVCRHDVLHAHTLSLFHST